jgi:Tol biopolymer transport system component
MKLTVTDPFWSLACTCFLAISSPATAQDEGDLPGPQLNVPVEIDGDGESTIGDVYLFNWWLANGGSVEEALLNAEVTGQGIIDLSKFFASPQAVVLRPLEEGPVSASGADAAGGGAGAGAGGCVPPGESPNFTRRIPPDIQPSGGSSQDARTTPDARYTVFASRASNLPGANTFLQIYRFEQSESATSGTLIRVSRTSAGAPAPSDCFMPSISDDGTQVVFHTAARLVPGDTDNFQDIYLVDMVDPSGAILTWVSAPRVAGARGNSYGAAISGNGEFVAFTSAASDLVSDANGTVRDVLRYDLCAQVMELASLDNSTPTPRQSGKPFSTIGDELGCPAMVMNQRVGTVISNNGSRVVFCGTPCDWRAPQLCPACFFSSDCGDCLLDPGCTNCSTAGNQQVYLRDFSLAEQGLLATFRVSERPCRFAGVCEGDVAGDGCSRRPSISGDGSRIAFSSLARRFRNDDGFDPDDFEDIFFIDVETLMDATINCVPPTRVSIRECGLSITVNGHSFQPMLSTDGTRIAFASDATNLLEGDPCPDTNGQRDVFIRRTTAPAATMRFSISSSGAAGNGASMNPDVTGDGRIAVYESAATSLIADDTNIVRDVFQTLSPGGPFIRGDASPNGAVDISDAVFVANWLFVGGFAMPCIDAADANDDGEVDVSDAAFISNFIFAGGIPPPCPFSCTASTSCCGNDPTADGLPCGESLAPCLPFLANGSCPNCP